MRRDAEAAVGGRDRVAPGRGVRAEVAPGDPAAGRCQPPRLALADLAVVEVVEAGRCEAFQRGRERRQLDDLARTPAPALRPEDLLEPGAGADHRLDRPERRLVSVDEP